MMAFKPTVEQQTAIDAVGNTLVAAAAGSGKTAVLVERVIKILTRKENPISADKLLIVTFTNAAANEMRSRIEQRLSEECRKNPNDVTLNLQRHLLNSAMICTIDAFCIDLVRENFEKLQIQPDFKIGEDNALKAINEKVAASIIDRYLMSEDPDFAELLDIVGTEKDEKNFLEFLLGVYDYAQHLPFPESFYNSLSEFYQNGKFNEDSIWAEYAFDTASTVLEGEYELISNAKTSLETYTELYEKYSACFDEMLESIAGLELLAAERDWDKFYRAINSFALPKIPTKNKKVPENDDSEEAKKYLKETPTRLAILKKLFFADSEFISLQHKYLYKPICLLNEILLELDASIFEEYLKNNTLTFHNVEQLAFKLLCKNENGEIVKRDDIGELVSRYDAVMVDEFQDVNNLQDIMFTVLADDGKNLFVVGDVKQSIYGFRGSNARNFLNKKDKCILYTEHNEEMPKKIILGKNFRCKPESCEFINYFFELFMTRKTGIIEYDSEEHLIPGAEYPELTKPSVEYDIITGDSDEYNGIELEALRIVQYIRNTMSEGDIIRVDKETLRPAQYSDFAILLRSAKNKGPVMAEILKSAGIPVNYQVGNFTENTEISIFLRLLSVIDNPHNDVDLLCILLSSLFTFTTEEIAKIRADKKRGSIYSAFNLAASKGNKKAGEFLESLERFRLRSVTMSLAAFISYLLQETDYIETVSLMSEGERRRANLLLLCQYAEQFAQEGVNTVGTFAKRLRNAPSNSFKSAGSSGGNVVKIMSIHKSKGLQFPICIVANLGAPFNIEHHKLSNLYITDFGIGFKYYDENLKTKLSSLSYNALTDRIDTDTPEEELRLFYVAMTRTQDRLVFFQHISNFDTKIQKVYRLLKYSEFRITKYLFRLFSSFGDWMLAAAMLHPLGSKLRPYGCPVIPCDTKSRFKLEIVAAETLSSEPDKGQELEVEANLDTVDAMRRNFSYKYPFEDILELQSKASVSKLANSAESAKYAFKNKPSFMSEGGITASGRGTAMHKCIEFFDFSKTNDIASELDRLYEWQYITEEEKNAIDIEALNKFFGSEIFSRMMKSELLKREMRFLTEVNAERIAPELKGESAKESVIIQGAVDVCFTEPDGLVILDFKTDRVSAPEALKTAYSEQLNIYAAACEKIFGTKVKQKIIYSFALGKEIEV